MPEAHHIGTNEGCKEPDEGFHGPSLTQEKLMNIIKAIKASYCRLSLKGMFVPFAKRTDNRCYDSSRIKRGGDQPQVDDVSLMAVIVNGEPVDVFAVTEPPRYIRVDRPTADGGWEPEWVVDEPFTQRAACRSLAR